MDINSNQTPSYAKYDTRRRIPNPATAALLVIDVQNHFSSIVTPILPSLNSTISLLRSHRIPIIFTRHRHRHVTLSTPSTLSEWWGPNNLILEGTFDSQLMDGLDRRPDDLVVVKETYSAFRGTGLEGVLRGMGVEEVVVVGVMTNLCCETTAREAFVRGFRVFFSTDATGTRDWEMQEATVMNLAYGFAYLVDCGRLKEGLGGKGG